MINPARLFRLIGRVLAFDYGAACGDLDQTLAPDRGAALGLQVIAVRGLFDCLDGFDTLAIDHIDFSGLDALCCLPCRFHRVRRMQDAFAF